MACRKQSDFPSYIPSSFKVVVATANSSKMMKPPEMLGWGYCRYYACLGLDPAARERSHVRHVIGGSNKTNRRAKCWIVNHHGREGKCTKQSESVLLELSINKAPINAMQIHSCHELLVSPV